MVVGHRPPGCHSVGLWPFLKWESWLRSHLCEDYTFLSVFHNIFSLFYCNFIRVELQFVEQFQYVACMATSLPLWVSVQHIFTSAMESITEQQKIPCRHSYTCLNGDTRRIRCLTSAVMYLQPLGFTGLHQQSRDPIVKREGKTQRTPVVNGEQLTEWESNHSTGHRNSQLPLNESLLLD